MRQWRWLDRNHVPATDVSPSKHDAHDASFSNKCAIGVALENRSHQSGLKSVELGTRIAQAGHLDDRVTSEVQPCALWQRQQIDAARRDVFADLARHHRVTACLQLLEQLGMEKVHLTQVRLR